MKLNYKKLIFIQPNLLIALLLLGASGSTLPGALSQPLKRGAAATGQAVQRVGSTAVRIPAGTVGSTRGIYTSEQNYEQRRTQALRDAQAENLEQQRLQEDTARRDRMGLLTPEEEKEKQALQRTYEIRKAQGKLTGAELIKEEELHKKILQQYEEDRKQREAQALKELQEQKSLWARFVAWLRSYKK